MDGHLAAEKMSYHIVEFDNRTKSGVSRRDLKSIKSDVAVV